jgi:hypothetical protein
MMFRRPLWIAVAGLIAVAAVHAGLARTVSQLSVERYLQREGELSQEFLAGIFATEPHPEELFAQPSPSPTLVSFAAHVRRMPGLVRASVYSPDGFIRHSTEANLIGVQFKDNKDLNASLGGRPVVDLIDASEAGKDEHLALNRADGDHLIEAYVPVPDAAGKVVAVVEFYRPDTAVAVSRARINRAIWLSGAANGAVVLAVAFFMSRRPRPASGRQDGSA